jgi:hypothetical protein
MSTRSDRLRELFVVFVWEGIKFGVGLLLAGSALLIVKHGTQGAAKFVNDHRLAVGLLLGALGAALILRTYYTLRYHALPKQEYDFEQIEREVSFRYGSSGEYAYRKRILLRALRQGLDCYHDKFKWTGTTPPNIHSAIEDQAVHLTAQKAVWQIYEVRFPRTLNKGEQIETDVVFDLRDEDHSFQPFISTHIEGPTKKLTMKLQVHPALGITHAFCEISSGMGARVPYFTEEKSVDRSGQVTWPIDSPKMHHYYELRWNKPRI